MRFFFVDPATEPGGLLRTRRIEGFVCELGWHALRADAEIVLPLLARLELGRSIVRTSFEVPEELAALYCGPAGVRGDVVTLRSGLEEIVQAARRLFPGAFLTGRPVLRHTESRVVLGGQVQHEVLGDTVVATPDFGATTSPSLWLGFEGPGARRSLAGPGFGVTGAGPLRAALFGTTIFPGTALRDRCAVRFLLRDAVAPADAEGVAREAEALLRERTGIAEPVVFRRLL